MRRTAFLVSLFTRDQLVQALRGRDPELQRQLVELETFGQETPAEEKLAKRGKGREADIFRHWLLARLNEAELVEDDEAGEPDDEEDLGDQQ